MKIPDTISQSCRALFALRRKEHSMILGLAFALISTAPVSAQTAPAVMDQALFAEIARIGAVDNHTHVPRLLAPGEKSEDEYDALPCGDYVEASRDPAVAGLDDPTFLDAWRALWGYQHDDRSPEHVRQMLAAKQRRQQEQGARYPLWVLDQLGIDVMFANRIAMGRGLESPRFRWVPYADALMYPLNNQAMRRTPDRNFFYGREEMLLERYMRESGAHSRPTALAEYLSRVVTPTLERWKRAGAVAVKLEMAYLRSLDVAAADQQDAARIYAQNLGGQSPPRDADYKLLQDFLFRYIAQEAGRLGLAVHIHTGAGCGGYFFLRGSDPTQLESVVNDASLRKTNFVLVHGGWPYTKQTAFLLGKPNVYADFSYQTLLTSTRAAAAALRDWLEWFPEKILFGTDLSPGPPGADWEEVGWVVNTRGRQALTLALSGMIADGEITRERALQLARMALRENAIKLYGAQLAPKP